MAAPVRSVMVIGYGTMGKGVLASFAAHGFATIIVSRAPEKLDDLPEGTVAAGPELPTLEAPPDLIVENVPEDMALKLSLLAKIEAAYGGHPIIATNTSSLPIDELAAGLSSPGRFLGIHYMQPADAFDCVEVIRATATDDVALERACDAVRATQKLPIVLSKPIEGFLFNRLQHALLHEAYYLIENGYCTAADVDNFAKMAFGPRMSVTGVIEQKDLSGLVTHAASQRGIVPHLHHGVSPAKFVQEMPDKGKLGAASGQGFYDWTERDVAAARAQASVLTEAVLQVTRGKVGGPPLSKI